MVEIDDIKTRMQRSVDAFVVGISSLRTGRATTALVENITVSVYGGAQRMRIMELGSITISDPQTITISLWDESIIGDLRKGILEANIGLNPIIDGAVLRINVPPLTLERRDEFVKQLHKRMEEGRVGLRQIRHDKMAEIKKALESREITEDDCDRLEKRLQEETDKHVALIEEAGKKKEAELLEV